jgi:large subunit ribosomal protein L17
VIESLLLKEKIKTTEAKAKEISGMAENIINKAKNSDITTIRNLSKLFSRRVVDKLIKEIAPRYSSKSGGYTRIIKLGSRKSDDSKIAIIELVK